MDESDFTSMVEQMANQGDMMAKQSVIIAEKTLKEMVDHPTFLSAYAKLIHAASEALQAQGFTRSESIGIAKAMNLK